MISHGTPGAFEFPVTVAAASTSRYHSVPPPGLHTGRRVQDRYVVGRPLARGAWAGVFEAWDEESERAVAIKVPVSDEQDVRRRFVREGRTVAGLQHPNVLEVHDCGQLEDGTPFLVMELLDGRDLAAYLEQGLPSIGAVVDLGRQLASALGALAEAGVVHRDVKPQNIVLHHEGDETVVKLVDFGVSKDRASLAADVTDGGVVVGTPYYLSPEQVNGEPLDPRSDLFSLGVVLYESLTGRHPFTGDSVGAVAAAILDGRVTPILERRPECPRSLAALVEGLLARDPDDRPSDPREVQQELDRIAGDLDMPKGMEAWKPVRPSAPSAEAATPVTGDSMPRRWAVIAIVALLVIAGATAWGWIGPW